MGNEMQQWSPLGCRQHCGTHDPLATRNFLSLDFLHFYIVFINKVWVVLSHISLSLYIILYSHKCFSYIPWREIVFGEKLIFPCWFNFDKEDLGSFSLLMLPCCGWRPTVATRKLINLRKSLKRGSNSHSFVMIRNQDNIKD